MSRSCCISSHTIALGFFFPSLLKIVDGWWGPVVVPSVVDPSNGPGCVKFPHVLKLRIKVRACLLVFVFRNKYLLLNSQELNELSAISLKANIPEVEALVNTDR